MGEIMRTISEIYRDRLVAEADEADAIGLTKIAENLTRQIESNQVRSKNSSYTYSAEEFEQDIQDALWNVVVRTADFHGAFVDATKAQDLVDHFSREIISNIRSVAKISSVVGGHEPKLPGEKQTSDVLEVGEDDE